jgi:voltage-gated potassium channel
MGHRAVETLLAAGEHADHVVVIDTDNMAVTKAREAGLTAIMADATRTAAWTQARIESARAVIVTVSRDDTATLTTLTVRELNRTVPISAAVREAENAHLLSQSGATTVVLSSEAAGRLIGLSTDTPRAVSVLADLLLAGHGLELAEDPAGADEFGGPPRQVATRGIPIALVRDGTNIGFGHPAFQHVEPGDIVVSIVDVSKVD